MRSRVRIGSGMGGGPLRSGLGRRRFGGREGLGDVSLWGFEIKFRDDPKEAGRRKGTYLGGWRLGSSTTRC